MKKGKRRVAILLVLLLVSGLVLQPAVQAEAADITSRGIIGDANGVDDTVNVKDLVRLKRYVQNSITDISPDVDLNKDGIVSADDLAYLRVLLAGGYQTLAATKTLQVGRYDTGDFTLQLTDEQLQIVEGKALQGVTIGTSKFSNPTYNAGSLTLARETLGDVGEKTIAATFRNEAGEIAVVTFDVVVHRLLSRTITPSDEEFMNLTTDQTTIDGAGNISINANNHYISFTWFGDKLTPGNIYEFTVKMQGTPTASSDKITMKAGDLTVKAKQTITAENEFEYRTQICWSAEAKGFQLFRQDGAFVGKIVSLSVVDKTAIKTAITNGGATATANDGTLTYAGTSNTYAYYTGDEGAKKLHIELKNTQQTVYLSSFTSMFEAGKEYTLQLVMTDVTGTAPKILLHYNTMAQISGLEYSLTSYSLAGTGAGKTVYTTTFTAPESCCMVRLYTPSTFSGNIESAVLVEMESGYTVKSSDATFYYVGKYAQAEMVGESLSLELTTDKNSFILHSFDGMLTAGKVYEITVTLQGDASASASTGTMGASNGYTAKRFVRVKQSKTAAGCFEYKTQIRWPEGGVSLMLYRELADLKGNLVSVKVVDKTAVKAAIATDSGAQVTVNDGSLTYGGTSYENTYVIGETGAKKLHLELNSGTPGIFLHSFTEMLEAGQEYELEIVLTNTAGSRPVVFMTDKNLQQLKESNDVTDYKFDKSEKDGKTVYTTTFTALENAYALKLYQASGFSGDIESITLKQK